MVIHGFQKLTLLDYPGKVACTLFSGGCNFRCPFCQNGNLVQHPEWEPVIPEEEIFAVLEKRRGVLDGVCVKERIFNQPELEHILKAHSCGRADYSYFLFSALVLELFLKK